MRYSNNLINKLKNKLIYFFAKTLYKFSDLIITNSEFEKKFIQNKFQLNNVICIHPPSIKDIIKKINTNQALDSGEKKIYSHMNSYIDMLVPQCESFQSGGGGNKDTSVDAFKKIIKKTIEQ